MFKLNTTKNIIKCAQNSNGSTSSVHLSVSTHKWTLVGYFKGALSWYGKLTWESAHACNLIIVCLLIDLGMTFIFMVHFSFYANPLLIYDVMYAITTIPQGTHL